MLESSKYNVIWKNARTPNIITNDDCEYASFLKDLERICSNTGYLDSRFYTKHADIKLFLSESESNEKLSTVHAYDVAKIREKFLNDYETKMKKINMALLQQKTHERVLKRHEGDIIKRQHLASQSLRDFETEVNNKKYQQDRKLNETATNLDTIRMRHYYDKSRSTKERMKIAVNRQTEKMIKSRKINLNVSKLLREFNAKKSELDTNSNSITQLMGQFEVNLSQEENKHKKLQKELESISEVLRLEIAKSQTQKLEMERDSVKEKNNKEMEDKNKGLSLSKFLNESDGGIKDSETERKWLDARLSMKNAEHSVKRKEYSGALNTIRNKLAESENTQRKLIADSEYINVMMRKTDNQNKIECANLRKSAMKDAVTNELSSTRIINDDKYDNRMFKRQIAIELAGESDNLAHIKSIIKNDKEKEQNVYKRMNESSKEMKQESIIINRLTKELHDFQVMNASRINEDVKEANKREKQLEEELNRQRTRLIELQTKRNNYFNELVSCRKYLHENKYHLQKSEIQTSRLVAIKTRGDDNQSILPPV